MDNDETHHHEEPGIEAWIDPAWEARIVALLQGEASDFEREDLEQRMRENPELRVFHRRMLAVHGLLGEAFGAGAGTAGAAPLRLSPERRAAVLERIRENAATEAGAVAKGPKPMNLVEMERPKAAATRRKKAWIMAITSAAAVFVSMFAIARHFVLNAGSKNITTLSAPAGREDDTYGFAATDDGAQLSRREFANSMKQKPAAPAPLTGPTTSLQSTVSSDSITVPASEATPSDGTPALLGARFGDGFGAVDSSGGFGGGGAQVAGNSESHFGNEVARFAIPDAPTEEVKERWFAEMDGKAGAKAEATDSPAPPEMLFGRPATDRPEVAQVAGVEDRERLSAFYKQNQTGQAPAEGKPGGTAGAEATDGRALAAVDEKGLAQEERFRWASQPGAITMPRGSSAGSADDPVSEDSYRLDRAEQQLARVEAKADDWSDRNAPLVAPGGELARGGDIAEEDRASALASTIPPGEPGARPSGGVAGAGDPVLATPGDLIAKAETAKEMDSEGRFDDGIRTLDESVVGEPASELGDAGSGPVRMGTSGEPVLPANQAVAATVQERDRLKDLGRNLYDLGDFDNAETRYKEALGVDGTDAGAQQGLEEIEKGRLAYRNAARDHTRGRMLGEADQLWEAEVPAPALDNAVAAKGSGVTSAENVPATNAPESTVAEVTAGKKAATDDYGLASLEKLNLGEAGRGGDSQGGRRSGDVPIQWESIDGLLNPADVLAAAQPESGLEAEEAMKQQQGQVPNGEATIDLGVSPEIVEFEGFLNRGLTVAEAQAPGGSDKADQAGLPAIRAASTTPATDAEPADPAVVTGGIATRGDGLATGLGRSEGAESAPAKDAVNWAFKAPEVGGGELTSSVETAVRDMKVFDDGQAPSDEGIVSLSSKIEAQREKVEGARVAMLDNMESGPPIRGAGASSITTGLVQLSAVDVEEGAKNLDTLKAQVQSLQGLDGEELIYGINALGVSDTVLRNKLPKYQNLQKQYEELSRQADGDQRQEAVELRARLDSEREKLTEAAQTIAKSLETSLAMGEMSLASVESSRKQTTEKSMDEKRKSDDYIEAKNQYQLEKDVLAVMQEQLSKKEMEVSPDATGKPALDFAAKFSPMNFRRSIADKGESSMPDHFAKGFLAGETLAVSGNENGRVVEGWSGSVASVDKELADMSEQTKLDGAKADIAPIPTEGPAKPAEPAAESAPEPTPPAEPAPPVEAQPEIETAVEPVSTFSLHVSDVSFKLAEAALLERGEWPEAGKVRIEEFVNAFDYGDPAPAPDEAVACHTEQAAHPFLPQRNLLRVAMRTGATGRASSQPLRLTVLLDKSGSMERADREASVRRAMDALASHLTANDSVTLIGFARQPRLIADRLSGERANELAGLVERAPSEGGTNLEEALKLAGDKAREQFVDGGQNRIVLVTDGAANLGNARPESLGEMVVGLRQQGIAFDACGVGADGLNDAILEALTRQGDGRYYFLNRPADADESFVRQLAGALRPAAKNVKVQVIFNPGRVRSYRLLGFEKHLLKKEDFRNDAVDAAEMAAAEAGVGLYEMEMNPAGQGDVGEVFVRFQDMATGAMVERSWTIPHDAGAAALDEATPTMQLAGTAAYLGMKLRGGPDAGMVRFDGFGKVTSGLRAHYAESPRVRRLLEMVEKVRGGE